MDLIAFQLGPYAEAVDARLQALDAADVARRLWAKDPTLWGTADTPELVDRLGWLDGMRPERRTIGGLVDLAGAVVADGIRDVVLLGMGGSSLAPQVFAAVLGHVTPYPRLHVLDTTHPAPVARALDSLDPATTLVVVASKSGTTIETTSLMAIFWAWAEAALDAPGRQFVAVTDPGTPLVARAHELEFREWVPAPADVGGRFSAWTVFGLLPAALLGQSPAQLWARVADMAQRSSAEHAVFDNPGVVLGAALGELAQQGADKLWLSTSPGLRAVPAWLEQLIAESLGKDGRGVLPVPVSDAAVLRTPAAAADDAWHAYLYLQGEEDPEVEHRLNALHHAGRPVLRIGLEDRWEIGREMAHWALGTAVAGHVLGVHPFDQPNVQAAKQAAAAALSGTAPDVPLPLDARDAAAAMAVAALLDAVPAQGYVALLAYLDPEDATAAAELESLASEIGTRTGRPVTVGLGPRYLHSTGQLHKGGPAGGAFLQLVDQPAADLPVPGRDTSLARLIAAQANGDAAALLAAERPLVRLNLGERPAAALAALRGALKA